MAAKKTNKKAPAGKKADAKKPPTKVDEAAKLLAQKRKTKKGKEVIDQLATKNRTCQRKAAKKAAKDRKKAAAPAAAAAAPAKKAPAKKKAAAKKKPAAAKKKPAAAKKKAAKKDRVVADNSQAYERLQKSGLSKSEVEETVQKLLENRSPAAKGKKKKRPSQKARTTEDLTLNQALDGVAANLPGISKDRLKKALEAEAAKVGKRLANPVHHNPHEHGEHHAHGMRMPNPTYSAGQIGIALGTLAGTMTLIDVLDRFLATRAPGDCKVYGEEAKLRINQNPGALRFGVEAGIGVLGFVGSWFAYKKGHTTLSAVSGAVGTGASVYVIYKGLTKVVLPMIFSAKDDKEESIGNRLYPAEQKYAQEAIDKLVETANKACEANATKSARALIVQRFHAKSQGLLMPGENNGQAGTAGAPRNLPEGPRSDARPPVPPMPARTAPAPSPRGEPRARAAVAAAGEQAGVGGCGGKCGQNKDPHHKPCTDCAKKKPEDLGVEVGPPAFYNLKTGQWHDDKGHVVAEAEMDGRVEALQAGVRWFRQSDGAYLLEDAKTRWVEPSAQAGTAAAPAAAPAAAAPAADVAAKISSVLDNMGRKFSERFDSMDSRISEIAARESAGTAAPPAPVAASDDSAAKVLEALTAFQGNVDQKFQSMEAKIAAAAARESAGTAAPPAPAAAPAAPAAAKPAPRATGTDDNYDPLGLN